MAVLVTGGAGFIGSHLCDALVGQGEDVFVVDDLSTGDIRRLPDSVEFFKMSVIDADELTALVESSRPSVIFHLAAQVSVQASVAFPGMDAQINVVGTVNVLEAARRAGARVVFASTGGALYGPAAPVPSPESSAPAPQSAYGIAKCAAERYVEYYNQLHKTNHSIIRFANVYGPRQSHSSESGVVSIFCAQTLAGQPVTIYGDGRQTRDYVYVSDAIAALLAATRRAEPGTWNIGTGIETSVLHLAGTVSSLGGTPVSHRFAPARAGEVRRSALCAKQAERDLDWRPLVSLRDGVAAVYDWIANEEKQVTAERLPAFTHGWAAVSRGRAVLAGSP
jgi:UDP-glucose 4-epimerase